MTGTNPHGLDDDSLEPEPLQDEIVTISDEGPEPAVEGELLPGRPIRSRSGLPLTAAVGRLDERTEKVEDRLWWVERALGVTAGVVIGLALLGGLEAVGIACLWWRTP